MKTALELRFSASYASRYHNCHGSANLDEAIPGFEFRPKERAKARDEGTAMHTVFENMLVKSTSILEAAYLMRELQEVRGQERVRLLKNERDYLVWWFMKEHRGPVMEVKELLPLILQKENSKKELYDYSVSPKSMRFLADAAEYVALTMGDDGKLYTEKTSKVDWLESRPLTTTDVLIRRPGILDVMDLKTGTTPVATVENEQLLYYARTELRDEEEINLHILQDGNMQGPWTITREHLLSWAEGLKESERAILAGDLTLKPGSHCTFCPANPQGRGDKGYPFCPVRVELVWGSSDAIASDDTIIDDEGWEAA